MPFDTEAEARAAQVSDDVRRFLLLCHEIYGGCREVISVGVEEATSM